MTEENDSKEIRDSEATEGIVRSVANVKGGELCRINGSGDLYFEYETRIFIGQECTVIKKTKSNFIQVRLNSNPKKVYSFPQRNIDLI